MRTSILRRSVSVFVLASLLLAGCGGGSSDARISITYVALGASDAVGIGAVPLSQGYVYEIESRLLALPAEVTFDNLGISGAHVDDIVDHELADALAAAPTVVTLWTGANDLVGGDDPDLFAAELDTLLGELATKTGAQVFVGNLPDLTQAPTFRNNPDPDVTLARIAAFNDRIASTVARYGFVLVLLSDADLTDDMFFVDGFHPNNAGYDRLADLYWQEMAPRL